MIGSLLRRIRAALSGDRSRESGDDGDGEDSVWSAIPYDQWGRHAESGGMTKAEQSDAVSEVQERASEYEDAHDH